MSATVRAVKIVGVPHTRYEIWLDGVLIRSQLHPYSEAEVDGYVAAHLAPKPTMRPLVPGNEYFRPLKGKPGPKPKGEELPEIAEDYE
jgi:hypothetical protein